jgi:two-component system, sensor histidine kinase
LLVYVMPEEKLKTVNTQLRALASRIQNTREEERKRIAREIHDELGQSLSVLLMDFQLLKDKLVKSKATGNTPDVDKLLTDLENMSVYINSSVEAVNRIIAELRPTALDTLGLLEAIRVMAADFRQRWSVAIVVKVEVEQVQLPEETSIEIYRIIQEALSNVARHAHATEVQLLVYRNHAGYVFEVLDNGIGISTKDVEAATSYGILGMRERAHAIGATLRVQQYIPQGTQVKLTVGFDQRYNDQNTNS